jgi:hypothetical protein
MEQTPISLKVGDGIAKTTQKTKIETWKWHSVAPISNKTKGKKKGISFFSPFVLLLLGASEFHHQLSTKRELGFPFAKS